MVEVPGRLRGLCPYAATASSRSSRSERHDAYPGPSPASGQGLRAVSRGTSRQVDLSPAPFPGRERQSVAFEVSGCSISGSAIPSPWPPDHSPDSRLTIHPWGRERLTPGEGAPEARPGAFAPFETPDVSLGVAARRPAGRLGTLASASPPAHPICLFVPTRNRRVRVPCRRVPLPMGQPPLR